MIAVTTLWLLRYKDHTRLGFCATVFFYLFSICSIKQIYILSIKKVYSDFLFEKRITKDPLLVKLNSSENSKNKSLS